MVKYMAVAALIVSSMLLSGCQPESAVSGQDARFIYKHVAELPVWEGNPETLTWINPESNERQIGIQPDLTWKANKIDMKKYQGMMMAPSHQPIKFSYDWSYTSKDNSCLEGKITVKNLADGGHDDYTIKQFRKAGSLKKYFSCLGSREKVSYAVETSKHIAFLTSEPSWLFYDKAAMKFMPLVVGINGDMASNLYINSEGTFFIDIHRKKTDSKSLSSWEKSANRIRRIGF